MPNDASRWTAETMPITLPATSISPADLMDRAMDKLRTAHLALAPDNKGWHDKSALMSVWATLEQVIRDLEPIRNRL